MADADAKEAPPRKKTIGSRLVSHMIHEEFHTWDFKTRADFIKTEVLLGITICFAQIPESVAFAFMAHIKPPVALHAAWVVGLICTVLGGRSGMVNGAEGAFAAIISTLVDLPEEKGGNGEGVELLFPSVMTAGAICFVVWAIGGHRYITLIAASVMDGFCCGLAVVIGMSQLHPFEIGHGVWKEGVELAFMIIIMLTAMLVMEFVPKIPHKAAKLLPSSLLAILSAVLIEYAIARNVPCPQTCAEHWAAHEIDMGGGHRRLDGGPSPTGFVAHVGRQLASAAAQLSEELHEHWVHDHEHKGGVLPDATSHNHSHTIGTECSAELEAQLAGMMCRTDVIGDVTPFTLTYPYPFFLNSDFTNYNMSKLTDDPGAPAAILLQANGPPLPPPPPSPFPPPPPPHSTPSPPHPAAGPPPRDRGDDPGTDDGRGRHLLHQDALRQLGGDRVDGARQPRLGLPGRDGRRRDDRAVDDQLPQRRQVAARADDRRARHRLLRDGRPRRPQLRADRLALRRDDRRRPPHLQVRPTPHMPAARRRRVSRDVVSGPHPEP